MNEIEIRNGKVVLHLRKEKRTIGEIRGEIYYKRINPSNHLFKKMNGIGFNYHLLKDFNFKFILVEIEGKKFKTSREYVLERGQILNFKAKDFERQIFVPLSQFGLGKIKEFEQEKKVKEAYEKSNYIQQNIF